MVVPPRGGYATVTDTEHGHSNLDGAALDAAYFRVTTRIIPPLLLIAAFNYVR
jgi:hypothetical protein